MRSEVDRVVPEQKRSHHQWSQGDPSSVFPDSHPSKEWKCIGHGLICDRVDLLGLIGLNAGIRCGAPEFSRSLEPAQYQLGPRCGRFARRASEAIAVNSRTNKLNVDGPNIYRARAMLEWRSTAHPPAGYGVPLRLLDTTGNQTIPGEADRIRARLSPWRGYTLRKNGRRPCASVRPSRYPKRGRR
jgi:hypothetical protein